MTPDVKRIRLTGCFRFRASDMFHAAMPRAAQGRSGSAAEVLRCL